VCVFLGDDGWIYIKQTNMIPPPFFFLSLFLLSSFPVSFHGLGVVKPGRHGLGLMGWDGWMNVGISEIGLAWIGKVGT